MNNNKRVNIIFLAIIFSVVLGFFALIPALINYLPEFLWFQDLGYSSIFLTVWGAKFLFAGVALVISFIFISINLHIALRNRNKVTGDSVYYTVLQNFIDQLPFSSFIKIKDPLKALLFLISLLIAFFLSTTWFLNWEKILLFLNPQIFGQVDPLFSKDLGFYFFSLPVLQLIQTTVASLLAITIIGVGFLYFDRRLIHFERFNIILQKSVKVHVSILLAIFFLILAWASRLNMYELLYSAKGIVYGAGYTDIHADLVGYWVMLVASIIAAVVIMLNIFRKGVLLVIESIVLLIIVSVVFKGFYPSILQQFIVKPNEIIKETPYIKYHIEHTKKAYGLDKVKEITVSVNLDLTYSDLANNKDMLENIRLWDHRPLLQTLAQLQEIRLYYDFNDVDIDRYVIDGKYRQVMLSARELNAEQLPQRARNWINQRLTYTHGYGLVMVPVNKMTEEGLPYFYLHDIPPKSNVDLSLNNPAIYYGESTNEYVLVNTKAKEFDYPQGDNNQYTTYSAKNGLKINGFWKKILFSLKLKELKIMLSNYITPESRLLFDRNIRVRAKKIAPFLFFDADPYIVIANDKLYWIIDAYTASSMYPYAQPFSHSLNYIRNSVKVVIDAYTGEINYYISDNTDPLLKAYNSIFPELFKTMDQADVEVKKHFRYPAGLFLIQAKQYSLYHMDDPQIFYNQEDLWVIPNETYEENTQPVEPYYSMLKLQEDKKLTFRLMMPFNPAKKNNLIGWMSANCDYPNYGNLTVYKMPKEKLIYGPMQIESRIDQDTEISKQLTLWGQKGSRVIRGNLLVIPINSSFLYIEPIYLQATQSRFPELKRIVVAFGNKLVMENDFETAIKKLFSLEIAQEKKAISTKTNVDSGTLIQQAKKYYQLSIKSIKSLNWANYGEYTRKLGEIISELEKQK